MDKRSGEVVWRAIGPGEQVLHGQWSSPVAANVNGRIQVLFGGGDGWLRSYDAASGHEVWRFDGNPKDARWLPRPGVFSRSSIIASPVFADGRVFVAMGQSPGHGTGPSLIHAIAQRPRRRHQSRLLWTSREVGRVVGTPIAKDGLLYVGDLGGTIHCLDAATGAHVWKHETNEAIWGSLLLAGDRLYVGNVEGSMSVLRAGRRKQLLGQIGMYTPLYSPPAPIGDALYLVTGNRLYLIAASLDPKRVKGPYCGQNGIFTRSLHQQHGDVVLVESGSTSALRLHIVRARSLLSARYSCPPDCGLESNPAVRRCRSVAAHGTQRLVERVDFVTRDLFYRGWLQGLLNLLSRELVGVCGVRSAFAPTGLRRDISP